MHNYCINKLLNLEDVIVKKIVHADSSVKLYLETKSTEQICPCCKKSTKQIHDYRYQTIKDLPLQKKDCYLVLNKDDTVAPVVRDFWKHTVSYHDIFIEQLD